MIHVFHGFLGSPEDFSFLRSDGVTLHDLTNLKSIEIHPEDTLVGYSMGGRVCLELASRVHFQIKKLVLLNAHPGLEEEEKEKEDAICVTMEQSNIFAKAAKIATTINLRNNSCALLLLFRLCAATTAAAEASLAPKLSI